MADFCEWAVTQRLGNADGQDWRSATSALLDAVAYGFRVSELIWEPATWDGRTYWVLDSIKARRHRRFSFGADDELMLVGLYGKAEPAPQSKFVVARLYPADDSPWGDPLLARVYALWLFKKAVWAYWIAYCEKFGQPLVYGTLAEDFAGNEDEIKKFEDMLAGIQQEGWARLAKGQELATLEFSRGDSQNLYEAFCKTVNREMSKLWVGATMILEESATGTQSMSTVLEGRFLSKVAADAQAISQVWTHGILRQLVAVNFGDDVANALTPTLTLAVSEQKDLEKEANVIKVLNDIGLDLSKDDLYTTFGRQRPKEDDPEDKLEKQAPPPQLMTLPGTSPPPGSVPPQLQPFVAATKQARGKTPPQQQEPIAADEAAQRADKGGKQFAESSPGFDSIALARQADADREEVAGDKQLAAAVREGADDLLDKFRQQMRQAGSLRALAEGWASNDTTASGIDPAGLGAALTSLYKLAWLRGALKSVANLGFVGIKDQRQFGTGKPPLFTLSNEKQTCTLPKRSSTAWQLGHRARDRAEHSHPSGVRSTGRLGP